MRIAITGQSGQIVRSMLERAPAGVEVIALGRPRLDLARPGTIAPALAAARPDIVVNAAAFTDVDKAQDEREMAMLVNGVAAGLVAKAAAGFGVPVVQISTDYVFDGRLDRPYREDDPVGPISVYGETKLAGERAVAAATPDHAILRTAWVYSPFGKNFPRTMLRLAQTRGEVAVVADQLGSPTCALDVADAIFVVAGNLLAQPQNPGLRGLFHLSAPGETGMDVSWADVAEAVFARLAMVTGRAVSVRRIATREYPTPAERPANSRLDCAKIAAAHGVRLPDWRGSLNACMTRLLAEATGRHA